jgi:hypothetical protein
MTRFYKILTGILLVFGLTACCSSKKQTQPPAREALPDRNTKDQRVDSSQKKVEKATYEIKPG